MSHYIFLVVWLLFCHKFLNFKKLSSVIITLIPVFALIAFRDLSVGTDSQRYLDSYSLFSYNSLKEAFFYETAEKGYVMLVYFLHALGLSRQWLFIVEALVFSVAIGFFTIKNANDRSFVLIVLILSLFEFSLSGIRQTFAISFVLLSYYFYRKNRWVSFGLLLGIAFFFHTSVLFISPLFIVLNREMNKKTILFYFLFLIVMFMSMSTIFSTATNTLEFEQYYLMNSSGGTFSFIFSCILLYVVLLSYKREKFNVKYRQSSHMTILYFLFCSIRFVNVMISRVILYVVVFPYLMIDSIEPTNPYKRKVKLMALWYLFLYFVYRIPQFGDYQFNF